MATHAASIPTWQRSNTPLTCRMLSSRLARSSGNVPSHVPAPGVATGLKTLALFEAERRATMKTDLLRFNGAIERDPAIDAWMKEHAGELGAIAHQWFEVMRKCGDEVRELCEFSRSVRDSRQPALLSSVRRRGASDSEPEYHTTDS